MDLLPTEPPPFRSDRLRQHVDRLPQPERTIVSRHYFGQEPIRTIAGEVGITEPEAKRCLANALRILRVRVERDHKALLKDEAAIRALSAAEPAGAGEVVSSTRGLA